MRIVTAMTELLRGRPDRKLVARAGDVLPGSPAWNQCLDGRCCVGQWTWILCHDSATFKQLQIKIDVTVDRVDSADTIEK